MNPADYRSHRDLPPLAGIGSFADAMQPGLAIDECVARLKRHHWTLRRLHEIFIKRLTAEPVYELKMAFSLHAHYCAEHAAVWRTRVGEMREPPLGLDAVPDAALDVFFDEILAAPATDALLLGIYGRALPALRDALARHQRDTNRLVDHPSFRLCRFALLEVDEMLAYGAAALASLLTAERRTALAPWTALLDRLLLQAGALDGHAPPPEAFRAAAPERQFSAAPHVYDGTPRRDARFPDPYNMGVHAEAFLYDESFPPAPKTLMMYYKRLREIDVPEMMASIVAETPGKPWGYYRDMSRQIWDEARHAMMGEVGFVALGVDWTKARITWNWSYRLNTECTPLERHGVLFFIEQGLMPKTGKRYEYETARDSGIPLASTIQDFDWADEVLHSQIGRNWYVSQFASLKEALDFGDKAWSKITSNWATVKEQGLTNHDNWWPEIYSQACAAEGVIPDAKVLAFAESYEGKRADLKGV